LHVAAAIASLIIFLAFARQPPDANVRGKQNHLLDGNPIEALEACRLRMAFGDEMGVEDFQIRQADKLGDVGIFANVPRTVRVFIPPLRGRFAKQGEIENVRLAGVDARDLDFGQFRRG